MTTQERKKKICLFSQQIPVAALEELPAILDKYLGAAGVGKVLDISFAIREGLAYVEVLGELCAGMLHSKIVIGRYELEEAANTWLDELNIEQVEGRIASSSNGIKHLLLIGRRA